MIIKRCYRNVTLGLVGIAGSPSKFSSLDWIDFKDDFGLIAGGKLLYYS